MNCGCDVRQQPASILGSSGVLHKLNRLLCCHWHLSQCNSWRVHLVELLSFNICECCALSRCLGLCKIRKEMWTWGQFEGKC